MFEMFANWGPDLDVPAREDVLADATVGGLAGLFQNIATGHVSLGQQWGANGTEFTGTGEVTGDSLFFLKRK